MKFLDKAAFIVALVATISGLAYQALYGFSAREMAIVSIFVLYLIIALIVRAVRNIKESSDDE